MRHCYKLSDFRDTILTGGDGDRDNRVEAEIAALPPEEAARRLRLVEVYANRARAIEERFPALVAEGRPPKGGRALPYASIFDAPSVGGYAGWTPIQRQQRSPLAGILASLQNRKEG